MSVIDSKIGLILKFFLESSNCQTGIYLVKKHYIERIELLENRISDDPFIPELVNFF